MKKMFGVMFALVSILVFQLNNSCAAAEGSENVSVDGTYIGRDGMSFTVSSTVGRTICVFPRVASSNNVTGSVVDMIQLAPNERGVNIGQFMRSSSRAWSIDVGAKWRRGLCADQ